LVFGTRPEAIKLAPLAKAMQQVDFIDVEICITAQHREMLDQVLDFFELQADYDLDLMTPGQSLFGLTSKAIQSMEGVLDSSKPEVVVVQGDTTTAFVGALAAYYKQIKVAHVEAGLRTGNMYSPFPEEGNRALVSKLAHYHFAPTEKAVNNLKAEGISEEAIFQVGNTVVDALFLALKNLTNSTDSKVEKFNFLDFSKRIVLITGHRRESFGKPFQNIFEAIKELAEKYSDAQFVYPVHLNPNVRDKVSLVLGNTANVHLIEPLAYPELVWMMDKSYLVLTDSGGIQEEAPSLGKPVLVMRDVTERPEGIEAGVSKLVTTDKSLIVNTVTELFEDETTYQRMATAVNPYGDGTTCLQIVDVLRKN